MTSAASIGDESAPSRCPAGHILRGSGKRCLACFVKPALPRQGADSEELPRWLGDYELLERLDGGAHGVVYRARRKNQEKDVAIKALHGENAALEIANLAQLSHPNIVYAFEHSRIGTKPAYVAMPWYTGGSLHRECWRKHFRIPARAVELAITLADALQYAHDRAILHGDIKPANILVNADQRPLLSDFSVSRLLRGPEVDDGRQVAGTPAYMAPEQAGARPDPVTTQTDIYGLGAVLFEVLTGRRARDVSSVPELLASFAAEPRPPRLGLPAPLADLEAVCRRALRFAPQERYRSAADFAEDLRRVQRGEWLQERTPTRAQRVGLFLRRHPVAAAVAGLGVLFVLATNSLALEHVQEQKRELQSRILRVNAALAKAQAQVALSELRRLRTAVVSAAEEHEPRLREAMTRPVGSGQGIDFTVPGFDSLWLLDCEGLAHANSWFTKARRDTTAAAAEYGRIAFNFRDYHRGTMALAKRSSGRPVYLSRAIHSRRDKRYKLVFGTPVHGGDSGLPTCWPDSTVVGALYAGRSASSTLGELQVPELRGSGQQTALFGVRDRNYAGAPLPPASAYSVLVHEHLPFGEARPVDAALSRRLQRRFAKNTKLEDQFAGVQEDPMTDAGYRAALAPDGARLLGGFYPVGGTGLVVAVETPYGANSSLLARLRNLALANASLPALGLIGLWFTFRQWDRHRRARKLAFEGARPGREAKAVWSRGSSEATSKS